MQPKYPNQETTPNLSNLYFGLKVQLKFEIGVDLDQIMGWLGLGKVSFDSPWQTKTILEMPNSSQ